MAWVEDAGRLSWIPTTPHVTPEQLQALAYIIVLEPSLLELRLSYYRLVW
jgi:hypothetical protein